MPMVFRERPAGTESAQAGCDLLHDVVGIEQHVPPEESENGPAEALEPILAARVRPPSPLVRVPGPATHLDCEFGVLEDHIGTSDEALLVVDFNLWPPSLDSPCP